VVLARLQLANVLVKPTLMAGGLIAVDNTLACHVINYRNRFPVSLLGLAGIAVFDGIYHLFNSGAQRRALTRIAFTMPFSLAGAFSCLSRVSQNAVPEYDVLKDRVLCGFPPLLSMLTGLLMVPPGAKSSWVVHFFMVISGRARQAPAAS